jgi:hypothetical protein
MVRWDPLNRAKCIASAEDAARIIQGDPGLGFLYRFRDALVGDDYSTTLVVYLDAYAIRTKTENGWTLKADNDRGWRFIGKNTHRKFAYPAIGLAIESFKLCKTRQAAIYDHRADNARLAIKIVMPRPSREDPGDINLYE